MIYEGKNALVLGLGESGLAMAQIGEFSFILAGLGTSLGVLPPEARDLILAGAIVSIFLNPFLFNWVMRMQQRLSDGETANEAADAGHIVLIGFGIVFIVGLVYLLIARPDKKSKAASGDAIEVAEKLRAAKK